MLPGMVDVAAIRALVDQYQGEVLLEKATVTLYEDVQEFWVAEDDGRVVGIHIDDAIIRNGRIDTLAFKPLARLGYSEYTTTENVWKMSRPDDPRYQ